MKEVDFLFVMFLAVVTVNSQTALNEFTKGNLRFTADMYKAISSPTNLIFSPFSIEIILALTRAGAKGTTRDEVTSALHLPNEHNTETALGQILPALKENKLLTFSSANKMYVGEGLNILENFKKIAVKSFYADIENIDFRQTQKAADTINRWVEQQTNNKIKNLLNSDSLNGARLVLVNALYFFGNWTTPFLNSKTRKEKFYTSECTSKKVDMMNGEGIFGYAECKETNAKYVELPYKDRRFTMTIVLPNEREGISQLESKMEKVLLPRKFKAEPVVMKLPKFQIESSFNLNEILQKLGIVDLFSDSANLSGISAEPLKATDVVHKAFINVTESGTEAAAVTAAIVSLTAALPPPESRVFTADHPFCYFIRYNSLVLFIGRVQN